MAVDEAVLHALADGLGQPTLRFYQWDPPCLSLGYNQPWAEVDEAACARLGYTWVRRPTGGRAILHTDELTYSVLVPVEDPRVAGGIVESYRRLSTGLLAGLRNLGAEVFQAQMGAMANPDQGAVCFDTPSHYEITVTGRKLVGSAQVRRRGVVLQHGTLPLRGDLGRIFGCLRAPEPSPAAPNAGLPRPGARHGFPPGQANVPAGSLESLQGQPALAPALPAGRDWLLERACTLEQALGRPVSFGEATRALADGFAAALNLRLEPGELTGYERSLAGRLREEQYASHNWNRRI